ncbi:MAG: Fic family protein [Nanoarchaeota archaeon]|nr:Fic family protein [Nanoarchaeota archaeon]MBU4452054.1 Fic family protein [Nanoarchaeota archaeon]MCG2724435.1 Fic family protein [archaeon]
MAALTKYDVLLYLSQMEAPEKSELIRFLKGNILFENVSERAISKKLSELKEDGFVIGAKINTENPKVSDCMAFLYWAKLREKDYRALLDEKSVLIFKTLFERGSLELKDLMAKTGLSKPTLFKYIKVLDESGFLSTLKKKPMLLKANLTDLTFFYAQFLDMSFKAFERQFDTSTIPQIHSKKLVSATISLHVHSTTVTEGNTATEDDVERVFGDFPVKLTPREVTEILNARSAINELFLLLDNADNKIKKLRVMKIKDFQAFDPNEFGEWLKMSEDERDDFLICKKDVNIEDIKQMHRIMMTNILERPGEFYYGTKRIAGFNTKLPSSKLEIDFSMAALINFTKKPLNPVVLASIAHFVFASIHPFADGNGRMARLLHSWILLKAGFPLFVFDPKKRNEYFGFLEAGRSGSIDGFINFCIIEHKNSLEKIMKK